MLYLFQGDRLEPVLKPNHVNGMNDGKNILGVFKTTVHVLVQDF